MNKKIFPASLFSMMFILLILTSGCKENETTKPLLTPDIYTVKASDVSQTAATTGGYITSDGGSTITARGVCWSTNNSPTFNDNKTLDGEGSGNFTSKLSGLALNTTYYVCAYATNNAGTSYGKILSFKTSSATPPVVSTSSANEISQTYATCGGSVTGDGYAPPVTERGVCWISNATPKITDNKIVCGSGTGSFSGKITGLNSNTHYYVRAYAINSVGISYGYSTEFTTPHEVWLPQPVILQVKGITLSSLIVEGKISDANYGTITERGFCWNTTGKPTINDNKTSDGNGLGRFSHYINNLRENTTYYLCVYATNEAGTGYGDVYSFTTSSKSDITVSDIDGNKYHTVTLGNQVWMVENLKTTRYKNGDAIPNITDQTAWVNLGTGAYCDYANNPDNSQIYGRLYNWYAVNDSRKLAPEGWHIATYEEWSTLIDYLGGSEVAGGKLKESGLEHWLSPNTDASNETGFTALPGGERNYNFDFRNYKNYGYWWCASESDIKSGLSIILYYQTGTAATNIYLKANGYSVRCIKDK
jgi:uncharacterized protein (TIGR02145 family)